MKRAFLSLAMFFSLIYLAVPGRLAAEPDGGKAADPVDKEGLLTLEDILRLRRDHVSFDDIVDQAGERGIGFEVTTAIANQLRRLGFRSAQVDSIKESPTEALTPGKGVPTTDEQRDKTLQEIKTITLLSRVELKPTESRHVTLWEASQSREEFLPTVEKLERFFRTKCREPIRSGLDKRSAHLVLLKTRSEYERWMRAMFDLIGERFDEKDNPGGNAELRASFVKGPGMYASNFAAICLADYNEDGGQRSVALAEGWMYFMQLAQPRQNGPLATGFANGAETIVAGSPALMIAGTAYHQDHRDLGADPKAWSTLVQQRVLTKKATPLDKLLQMDTYTMVQPHYAEAWTLVALLAKQPAKFGKLMLAIRKGIADLAAIKEVYGWDEKQLTQEWRKFVLSRK